MANELHQANKTHVNRLRRALYDIDPATLEQTLRECFAHGARVHLAHPFEELDGAEGLYAQAYRPLLEAVPDLERRDFIFMGGESNGAYWVGCAGHYMGVMERAWLDIPPHAQSDRHALPRIFPHRGWANRGDASTMGYSTIDDAGERLGILP